jgi:alpha-glucosidase
VQWWRDAVFYQVYVPSFTDSDGDGIGDLHGVRSRLGYLELLGVDALWLSPIYPSPMVDHGYDVTDHRAVEPTWGDLAAFDALVADAHAHGIRVTIDLVPNHTSDRHAWFRAALASPPGSPERARYHFRPGRSGGADGGAGVPRPPNDWLSVFGGPAWTREPPRDGDPGGDREFYLHLFSPAQPDLNWTNLEVWADLDKTLRFWLDRGVDGFRVDAAHGMCKRLDGGSAPPDPLAQEPPAPDDPRFDTDEVHDVHRMIRATLDHYPQRVAIGAVAARTRERFARYVRPDELHLAVDTRLAAVRFDADELRATIEDTLTAVDAVGAPATWALSDHDVARPASRYGSGPLGLARARAMALVQLALPGAVYLYNGDELGLPDAELPDDARRDAVWRHADHGRDGCRVPQPWDADLPACGFTTGTPWLPLPDSYAALSAAAQLEDTGSTLSVYRRALELRRLHPGFAGGAGSGTASRPVSGPALEWFGAPEGCLAFRRVGTTLVCALNTSTEPVPLPPGDALLASGPLDDGLLPPDTAVWLA